MRNLYLASILAVLASISVIGSSAASAMSDQTIKQSLKQVGQARFSVLFWDIYDSALYTQTGNYSEDEEYLLEITYLKNIKRDDLIKRTIEQWQHLGISESRYQNYVDDLTAIWPNIKKGDRLSLWVARDNASFYFNHQFIGVIEDSVFGDLFSSIWLSPDTSQPELRAQLLGLKK